MEKYLPYIIHNYNNSYHSTIKSTTEKIFNEGEQNKQTVYVTIPKFKIGDKVRFKILKVFLVKEIN